MVNKNIQILVMVISVLLFSIPMHAVAEQTREHDRYEVLMIGNSHSASFNLPGLVKKLIEHGLPGVPVYTELGPGSAFLADRISDSVTQPAIESRQWTHVVLQAQKYSTSGFFNYPTLAAEEFIRRIRAQDGLPVMFPEWPRFGNTEEGPRIHQLHLDIASREAACVAPIGLAWEVSLVENPDIVLHHADGNHANLNGAVLTAYVLYEVITREPASALSYQDNLGIDASTQRRLRVVASRVVQEHHARCSGTDLIAEPQALDFGRSPDQASSVQTVELVNNGLFEMQVNAIDVPERSFELSGGSCPAPPFTLGRDQRCSLEIEFSPQGTGLSDETLSVTATGLTRPINVQLRGYEGDAAPLLTPGYSAAFFNASRDGEGQLVEMLGADTAVVYTFTHRPDGSGPMWFVGVGQVLGKAIVIDELLRPNGTGFGNRFDGAQIFNAPVGSQSMIFEDCESGTSSVMVNYSGNRNTGLDSLHTPAERLSDILGCVPGTSHPNAGLSGSYFLPSRNGEGIVVQWLPDGQVLVYFFTFDLNNNQQWILGIGHSSGTSVVMDALYPSGNAVWGGEFDPGDVILAPWGAFELTWTDCGHVRFTYQSSVPGYGSATRNYVRLSNLWQAGCTAFN